MQLAGLEGQQVVLLLEDYQFVHPAFLEMINSLLSSGVYCVFLWEQILPFGPQAVTTFFKRWNYN